MIKLIKFTLIGAIGLFFAACGDNNPKGATEKFYSSVLSGNVDDFKQYSTKEVQDGYRYLCSYVVQNDKDFSKCLKDDIAGNFFTKFKIVDVKEDGSTSASVVVELYTKDNDIKKEEVRVEKFAEQWKVAIK
ncbi:MAG: DUF4878 domain-containing protein [Sulfurimonas sp.]